MKQKSMWAMVIDGEITYKDYQDYCAKKLGYKDHNDYQKKRNHVMGRTKSMVKYKECSMYLGVHISERLLSKVFENVQRMPYGNHGYDFICKRGYKIDVKSSCLGTIHKKYKAKRWNFNIRHNKIANYFLLLAFDNRNSLNPIHIWLISSNEIIIDKRLNEYNAISISNSDKQLKYLKKYEMDDKLEETIKCCNEIKRYEKTNNNL